MHFERKEILMDLEGDWQSNFKFTWKISSLFSWKWAEVRLQPSQQRYASTFNEKDHMNWGRNFKNFWNSRSSWSKAIDLKSLTSHLMPCIVDDYIVGHSTQKSLNKKLRKPFWGASSQVHKVQFCESRLRQCNMHVFWCVSMPNLFMPTSCMSEKMEIQIT